MDISEGEKRAPMGILKVSMEACTKMAISTLPFVLLKTHVMTMPKAMAMTTNLTISRKPLPPDLAKIPAVKPGSR